jgi:cytochrome c oxidase subunit 2
MTDKPTDQQGSQHTYLSSANRRHFIIVGILVAISTVVFGFLFNAALPLPPALSEQADNIDAVMSLHFWLIAFFFSLVVVFMLYSFVVFRRRKGEENVEGEHFEGNSTLEVVWTVVPLVLVLILGFIGWRSINEVTRPRENELVINAEGFQWAWAFTYPDSGVTSAELVLPVNQPIRMEMTAREVLHSFWIPQFRVKQDLVPGQTTILRFTPTAVDSSEALKVRCAEICGLSHWQMEAPVRVVSQEEFTAWVDEQVAAQGTDAVARQATETTEN